MAPSDDESRSLRPRIGGRRGQIKPQRAPTFRRSLLALMQQRFGRVARIGGPPMGSARGSMPAAADVREPASYARRCVVKARVVPMNAHGLAAARLHLSYIEREGVERDGAKGELYGRAPTTERDDLSAPLPGEKHQFRFIVSPEDAGNLDLKEFTRGLMAQVETDLGRRLVWGAVNHHDTDNPHVHVVVRGVDAHGHGVRLDRDYISRGIRWRAQEVLTRELGPRAPAELDRQRDRETGQERLTTLDRELQRLSPDGRQVDMRALADAATPRQRARLLARLQVLERLTLARRESPGAWTLATDWQASLRSLGERGDIIKRMHAALTEPGDGARYHIVDGRSEQKPIDGVVRRKGLHDELRGEMYAVVEDAAGRVHYVRIDAVTASQANEGAIVQVTVAKDSWAKEMDGVLAKIAAGNGGVYDPAAHVAALSARRIAIAGQPVDPKEVVAANLRRLERLARHQLVTRLPDGRWRVPEDLVAQLKAREVSHPRLQVRVDQVAPALTHLIEHRGPTWLDSATAPAAFGFGAEVRRATRERATFVQGLGIGGPAPEVRRQLGLIERRDFGEQLAQARGLRFVAEPPDGFRGMPVPCEPAGSGDRYVAVVDHAARRMTLMPEASIPQDLRGQVIEIARGADGRLAIRRRDLGRGA
jgi:type IV secretory pathway VirD2 relaxase